MKTEKIWSVFPVMYIPKAFIGSCFAGAMATSHAFFIFSVSISSGVGAFRAVLDDCARSFRVKDAV